MNQEPARKLRDMVAQYGPSICDDARRCEALLKDYCPQHEREVFLLSCALRQCVHTGLLASSGGPGLLAVTLARLTRRLVDELSLNEEAAQWAVESVAVALNLAAEDKIGRLQRAQPAAPAAAKAVQLPVAAVKPAQLPAAAVKPVPVPAPPAQPLPGKPPAPQARAPNGKVARPARRAAGVGCVLLLTFVVSAAAVIGLSQPFRIAWREQRIHHRLEDDEAWGELARTYARAGLSREALGCYEIARALDPDDLDWRGEAGPLSDAAISVITARLTIANDDWVRSLGAKVLAGSPLAPALSLFERAHELDPGDPENSVGRLAAQLRSSPDEASRWSDMADALTSAGGASQASSFSAVSRLANPDADVQPADFPAAMPALVAIGPRDVDWLTALATKAYSQRMLAVAEALFATLGSLEPANPDWLRRQEAVQTIATQEQALGNETPIGTWISVGSAHAVMAERDLAAAFFGVARLIEPASSSSTPAPQSVGGAVTLLKSLGIRNDEWIGDRGDRAVALGYTDAALDLYRWALSVDPNDAEWPPKRDRLLALQRLRQSIEAAPREDELWGDLGDAYGELGLEPLADGCYAIAWLLDPGDLEWRARGPALSSVPLMLRELAIGDDELIGDLGDAAMTLGNPAAAQALFSLARQLDPDDLEWRQKEAAGAAPAP